MKFVLEAVLAKYDRFLSWLGVPSYLHQEYPPYKTVEIMSEHIRQVLFLYQRSSDLNRHKCTDTGSKPRDRGGARGGARQEGGRGREERAAVPRPERLSGQQECQTEVGSGTGSGGWSAQTRPGRAYGRDHEKEEKNFNAILMISSFFLTLKFGFMLVFELCK